MLDEDRKHNVPFRGIVLANIEPGKPWQNGSNESFNGTFRKECLNAEILASLMEARVVIEQWRNRYNKGRPAATPLEISSRSSRVNEEGLDTRCLGLIPP